VSDLNQQSVIEGRALSHLLVELDTALNELTPLGFEFFDAHAATSEWSGGELGEPAGEAGRLCLTYG
jgi:hypothetical protein